MKDIQQLIKKNSQEGRYEDIFPKTFTDAVKDKESGKSLIDILSSFNMYFLSYNGSRELTRLQVPLSLRKTGLWITYVLYDKTVVTEWYAGEAIDDDSWKSPDNWRVGTNMLVGDISISSDGYWVVNGVVTTTKAQGEQGITPMLRVGSNNHLQASYTNGSSWVDVSTNPVYTQFRVHDNKLEQSVDLGATWIVVSDELAYQFRNSGNKLQVSKDLGVTWEDTSDYIAAWFRFTDTSGSGQNVGKIQISRDNGVTWSDLSGEFTNSLHIKGYAATVATLPSSAVQGDIYGVGPTYDPSDTGQTNPIYQLYVKDSTGWVNNGKFTSIAAGVVQTTGTSTTEVMSQDAVSKELASLETDLNELENQIYEILYKEIFKNRNIEETRKNDYELAGNGTYSPNTNYISSGDMYVSDDLQYKTDYKGNIFCYDVKNKYIGRVVSGNTLLEGTDYVRINWLKTQNAPYFYAVNDDSIQEVFDELIYREYKINGDDTLGYELLSDGAIYISQNTRVSQRIKLEDGKNYICNITANYYYYDENFKFLGRIYTIGKTVFNKSSYTGAAFMRTNGNIIKPIEIYEIDSNNNPVVQKIIFKGYAENAINSPVSISADETIESNINIDLPKVSSSIVVRFKTNQSLYKQSEIVELVSIGNVAKVSLVPRELTGDSIYCDKSEVDISVIFGSTKQTIPLRLNNYGKDLFSMRIKYPIVNVAPDGLTEMVTPMPEAYEGMYIEKTDTQFIIHNGDDSVFKSWTLSDYTDIDAFVEALKADTSITDVFEIKKYGCEGMAFSEINNFEKILLCKEHTELLYKQGADSPTYTGNVYWDSYPTIIRSSDIGYEHVLKVNYRVINEFIEKAYVSLDGMFLRFNNVNYGTSDMKLTANLAGIISQVIGVSVLPYKPTMTPMLSMQHVVRVNENLENTNMVTSTMRQYDMLAYLRKKGFVGQNFNECMASIRGSLAIDKPTYCLTFDDYQRSIWANKEIRDVFNQFRAKPTLIYLFVAEDLSGATPPSYALSTEEYKAAKASGWDIVNHGFCMYTNRLSYAQFYQGFTKNKESWLRWYGEDVQSYNCHGGEITDYQYYLMKHMGFTSISSGSAPLGWFCECGTSIDVQYKRVTWMDSELEWDTVKNNIDKWTE